MADLRENGYDKISLAHALLPEIEANLNKLNTYEPVIATDTKAMYYKDENGDLIDFANDKLSKGAYDGTAEDLKDSIEQNKSDILLKMNKGGDSIGVGGLGVGSVGKELLTVNRSNALRTSGDICILGNFNEKQIIDCKDFELKVRFEANEVNVFHSINSQKGGNNNNGYQKLATGTLIQYGYKESSDGITSINFPVSFTQRPNVIITPFNSTSQSAYALGRYATVHSIATNSFNYSCYAPNTPAVSGVGMYWIAIGY